MKNIPNYTLENIPNPNPNTNKKAKYLWSIWVGLQRKRMLRLARNGQIEKKNIKCKSTLSKFDSFWEV